jgi:uncharacterized membrane protein
MPEPADKARKASRSAYRSFIDILLTGLVVIIPLVVTLYVLTAAWGFIADALRPFIEVLQWAGLIESVKQVGFVDFLITVGIYNDVVDFLTTIIALLILFLVIVGIGLLTRVRYGERLIDFFDALVGTIPGVGSLYGSFRRMGDAMLESSVDNFQEVVLVEFPYEDVYVMGFRTSEAAGPVAAAAARSDMTTLFLPLAPNPVMGGFLAHIPEDRVMHVDMSVDEAVQTIITSGIATESPDDGDFRELDDEEVSGVREITSPPADGDGDAEDVAGTPGDAAGDGVDGAETTDGTGDPGTGDADGDDEDS